MNCLLLTFDMIWVSSLSHSVIHVDRIYNVNRNPFRHAQLVVECRYIGLFVLCASCLRLVLYLDMVWPMDRIDRSIDRIFSERCYCLPDILLSAVCACLAILFQPFGTRIIEVICSFCFGLFFLSTSRALAEKMIGLLVCLELDECLWSEYVLVLNLKHHHHHRQSIVYIGCVYVKRYATSDLFSFSIWQTVSHWYIYTVSCKLVSKVVKRFLFRQIESTRYKSTSKRYEFFIII